MKKRKSSGQPYLCYDLGGTKLLGALVTPQGRVLKKAAKRIDQGRGLKGLLDDFKDIADQLDQDGRYRSVAVASAGPLHSERGVLLDPTNFFTGKKSWGVVPLVAKLKKQFGKPVKLENDAAAAVLAEAWKGGHARCKNILIMTLGTGVGIGVITNGELVRAGRGLHPEVSHIPINQDDKSYPCGCGAYGCVEAYLAGSHFARHLGTQLGRDIDGEQCFELAEQGDAMALAAFNLYGQRLAAAIRSLAVVFAPEVVVLAGGFSKNWKHFLPATEQALPGLMSRYRDGIDLLPKIKVSKLSDTAGVIGAAFVANQK